MKTGSKLLRQFNYQTEDKAQAGIVEDLLKKTGSLNFKNTSAQLYLKKEGTPSKQYDANSGKGVRILLDTGNSDHSYSREPILPKMQKRLRVVCAQNQKN